MVCSHEKQSEKEQSETKHHVANGTEDGNAIKQHRTRLLDSTFATQRREGETILLIVCR